MSDQNLRNQILDGWVPAAQFAAAFDKATKTVVGWRRYGFPVAQMGRDHFVHVEKARAWLFKRATHQLDGTKKRRAVRPRTARPR
jgi:hypothetical protein